ncbi:hypothetical protein KTC96_08515 [Clostridium estertheticum]|uniref:hypothetical protein n=1 Tax=Clostridium estertheticum TaxID=238834 RepID=UPI001C7CC3B8|nr:hypothetical protein [Clostridium estertheticum]MBX4259991.1 hypothetical protein [Clostridium estertheticum]WLC72012.1 hypothetical protein KTC96_08515 [Clostridium estertheticum]
MEKELKELVNKLEKSITNDEFIDISYDVVEEIGEREDAFEAIQPILMLVEKNPNVDFGKPGPLVHFVEKFYKNGYEEKLVESLKRFPTKHTVWMLNRIINGSQGDSKEYFINLLEDVMVYPNIDNEVVLLAKHFRELHS